MTGLLNDSHSVFVIAEAGSNWKKGTFEEDVHQAKNLIDVASQAGADAVKFQTYRSETVYVHNAGESNYLKQHGIEKSINTIFEDLSMPYEMLPILSEYCNQKNLDFMSTPFSIHDTKEIDPFVEIHKIASFEINHQRLIEAVASTNKPVIVSTGASSYEDIDFTVKLLQKKNVNYVLLQCTSKYPCPLEALNLSAIPNLKQRYGVDVGLSDHSTDPMIAPLVAMGYGASIIEKHFTTDRNLPGPDHPFALEPAELKTMVDCIRKAEKTRGDGVKKILDEEQELWKFAKRSIQAIKDISKDEILREDQNFSILRPGNRSKGMDAKFLEYVEGKKSKHNVTSGDGINEVE